MDLRGQTASSITGKIIEQSTKESMEFVNVSLYLSTDSSLSAGVVTDKNGNYQITNVASGKYYMHISFIGFETVIIPTFFISNGAQIDKGVIPIKASSHVLDDIEVTAEKSLLETSIDKKVYNVGKDIMSVSGSASQILENVPSVSVGIEGNVSLRGSSNVTILVNGRPSSLMRMNSALALQQIPSTSIDRIEIITNPSAKYRPDGTAGIINIVMKKETKLGMNGTLTANAGNDDRYNSTLTFNFRPGNVNLFGSYGYRQDNRLRTSTDSRLVRDASGNLISKYEYINLAYYRPKSHLASLGMDYSINDNNTIGISGQYFKLNFLRHEDATTSISNSADQLTNNFNRLRLDDEYEFEKELSAYYEHTFKKEDHTLNLEFNLSDYVEEEDNTFTEVYHTPLQPNSYENILIRQFGTEREAALEYTYPLSEDVEIEAGFSSEWINQDFDFYGEYFDETRNDWIKDAQKSNLFEFRQMVHAAYVTYSQSIEDFGFELGLRGEDANIKSYLVTLDSTVNQHYFKFYPSIHLSYELDDDKEVKLSYSRRINRPEGDELNPFPEYDDPRNLYAGNPFIKPEQIHSFELGYESKTDQITLVPTLYYRYKYDGFTEVSEYINDSTLLTTFGNLSNSQSGGLELILSWRLKKLLSMNFSGNIFYNEIDASNLGYTEKKSAVSGTMKLGTNFNVTKSTILQLNANARLAELTPQGKYLPGYSLNTGLRQDLLKGKASLLLTVSDVFNSLRWRSEINTPQLYQITTGKRKSQIVYLGFSYRLGKTTKKTSDELKFDEQK
ncbi:MAG: TonB-dependent receptor [Bacteroidota bacterium]|nr:TonB-dependent receptor [Bacteroidota bacterium]